ncbi:MAG: TolC family outer membrane protein [Rhodobacteraceae bacterium]|nr:TolC family outer membrane protein [Paracoccaceae bacterium]
MTVRLALSALLAGVFLPGFAAPAPATSLADALAIAYSTNPQLKAWQAALRAADEDVISARANLLPVLAQELRIERTVGWPVEPDTRMRRDRAGRPIGRSTDYYTIGDNGRLERRDSNGNLQSSPDYDEQSEQVSDPVFTNQPALRSRNLTTTYTFNTRLTMQLWDGGADRMSVRAARQALLATRQDLRAAEQRVLLATVQAYLAVRRDREFVRLAENYERVLREQLRAAQDRFAVGDVTRTDVAQAEARLAGAIAQLQSFRGNLQRSEAGYAAVVGVPPGSLRAPPAAPEIPATPDAAETMAKQDHPELMQARFNAKAAEIRANATAKNRNPNLSLELDHTIFGEGNQRTADHVSLGIVGRMNIYQGGRLDSDRRRAVARWQQTLANVQQAGYTVRQEVRNAYTALRVASASIQANREAVRAAEIAFEGVKEEATLGARTTLDTLNAEQELLAARANLVTSLRDEYVATYQVLASIGLLTAKHLNLGVDLYDPDANTRAVTYKQLGNLSKFGRNRRETLDKITQRRGN